MPPDSRSVLDRPASPPDFTLAYGEHPDQVIDLRVGGPDWVIFLHGGFWRHEYDRAHTRPLADALVAAGYTVATPEFRRTGAPGGGWPGTFDDVAAAVSAAPSMVSAHTPIAGPPLVAGHSAGGHLALWVASRTQVRGVVALAPVADLALADELDLDSGAVRALLGGAPVDLPERLAAAQPAVPVRAPLVVLHGDGDQHVPVELSRSFANRAGAAGDDVDLRVLPGVDHFALIDPHSAAWPMVVVAFAQLSTRSSSTPRV